MLPKQCPWSDECRHGQWSGVSRFGRRGRRSKQAHANPAFCFSPARRLALAINLLVMIVRGGDMGNLKRQLDPAQTGTLAAKLDADLRKRIVGQDDAIHQIIHIYQTHLAGMSSPGRPIGNLLFLGPTGSGKTRLVEATAESLLGDARAVIKVDCAEFHHSHEIAKLIGSPPGYLGHRATHPLLSQEVVNPYHTERLKLSFVS